MDELLGSCVLPKPEHAASLLSRDAKILKDRNVETPDSVLKHIFKKDLVL